MGILTTVACSLQPYKGFRRKSKGYPRLGNATLRIPTLLNVDSFTGQGSPKIKLSNGQLLVWKGEDFQPRTHRVCIYGSFTAKLVVSREILTKLNLMAFYS